jgi:hypothetical protein
MVNISRQLSVTHAAYKSAQQSSRLSALGNAASRRSRRQKFGEVQNLAHPRRWQLLAPFQQIVAQRRLHAAKHNRIQRENKQKPIRQSNP